MNAGDLQIVAYDGAVDWSQWDRGTTYACRARNTLPAVGTESSVPGKTLPAICTECHRRHLTMDTPVTANRRSPFKLQPAKRSAPASLLRGNGGCRHALCGLAMARFEWSWFGGFRWDPKCY